MYDYRLRGLGVAGGQILGFSIDLRCRPYNTLALPCECVINVKNFHGSLTTVVRAQNDTSKTANITDTMFDRTYWYIPYKRRRFENR